MFVVFVIFGCLAFWHFGISGFWDFRSFRIFGVLRIFGTSDVWISGCLGCLGCLGFLDLGIFGLYDFWTCLEFGIFWIWATGGHGRQLAMPVRLRPRSRGLHALLLRVIVNPPEVLG